MEKIVEQGLLYDFYGVLLTQHQRSIYEDAVFHDLSLAEIAEEAGISRQGVHDLIRRCDQSLKKYEEKLHLVQRFYEIRQKTSEIRALAENTDLATDGLRSEICRLTGEIMQIMES